MPEDRDSARTDLDGLCLARPNRFEVDLDAVAHNAAVIRRLVGSSCTVFAALKANAYGYGIAEVAPVLLSSGVDGISLVSLQDAINLRHHGVDAPILLYPGVPLGSEACAAIEQYELIPTVLDIEAARAISATTRRDRKVVVKIDVGLERLGVAPTEAAAFVRAVSSLPRVRVHGVYAHMHVRGGGGVTPYLEWQFDRLTAAVHQLRTAGFQIPLTMAASTGVLEASATRMNLNAIDPGRVFFGLDRKGPGLAGAGLLPAFRSLSSRLIQVKPVARSEFQEMAPFPIMGSMRIGVIPIGRYDGMASLSCGQVLVRGRRVNILAPPSIEHSRVDLTEVPAAREGDEVVIIGRQGPEEISPDEVACHQALLSGGMVALGIRGTIPRLYIRNAHR